MAVVYQWSSILIVHCHLLPCSFWMSHGAGKLPVGYSSLPDTDTMYSSNGNVGCKIPVSTVNTSSTESNVKPLKHLGTWLSIVEGAGSGHTEHNSISFAAYHSTSSVQPATAACSNVLLPLLPDHIQSPATIHHLIDVIIHSSKKTNSGQPAVITANQPVYAVAKYIQWKYPNLCGENKLVMMMGGLHIEMAIQNMLGKWLAGSGWTDMFLKAGIATVGRCGSVWTPSQSCGTFSTLQWSLVLTPATILSHLKCGCHVNAKTPQFL